MLELIILSLFLSHVGLVHCQQDLQNVNDYLWLIIAIVVLAIIVTVSVCYWIYRCCLLWMDKYWAVRSRSIDRSVDRSVGRSQRGSGRETGSEEEKTMKSEDSDRPPPRQMPMPRPPPGWPQPPPMMYPLPPPPPGFGPGFQPPPPGFVSPLPGGCYPAQPTVEQQDADAVKTVKSGFADKEKEIPSSVSAYYQK